MDRPSFRSPKNWPFSTITSPLKMVVTGHPLMSQPSRIGAALAEFTVSKLWYFAGADWLPFRSYCPALRCKLRWRVSFSAQRAGRSYLTYPRLCGWQILLEELTNRRWEQRAYLTGEIPKEKVHPAEPQDLALLASVSCKYGNRDLKPCFYIPSLGVLQNPFHNLDIYLVYTAPRQSRALVPSPPVEPWLVTPSKVSWAR